MKLAKHHPMKTWRFKYDLSQHVAADKLGCTKSYWNEIENRKKEPSLAMAQKIVRLCGGDVSYDDLIL